MINERYKIIKLIGEGRSKVFICEDKYFPENLFAIKIISFTHNQDEIDSFFDEYYLLKKFDHPNIVSVYNCGTILSLSDSYKKKFGISKNDKFFLLDFIDGKEVLDYNTTEDEQTIIEIIKQLSSVLYYIHQSNYIYYDIKPENILISESSGKLVLKLIDFGLVEHIPSISQFFVRGTSEYIAPEIIKKETVDHRADLYSLGILLYRIVYGRFPFETSDELDIYRSHLEKDFEFPASKYSKLLIGCIQKLVKKEPSDRFFTSLGIFDELKIEIDEGTKLKLNSVLNFVDQKKIRSGIRNYLNRNDKGETLIIIGPEGSGKSELLRSIDSKSDESVLVNSASLSKSVNFWQQFLNHIIYSESNYDSIDESLKQYIVNHIHDGSQNLLDELKSIFAKITNNNKFILLLDDFDKLDQHTLDIFYEIFPVLLANNIQIIVTVENIDDQSIKPIVNKVKLKIDQFDESELKELVDNSYAAFFPKEELLKLIFEYSKRFPGNISNFISDLIVLEILDYTGEGPIISDDKRIIDDLLKSQDKVYEVIYNELSQDELKVINLISLFDTGITLRILSELSALPLAKLNEINNGLRNKNIFQPTSISIEPLFINTGFRKYVYDQIPNGAELHFTVAEILNEKFENFNPLVTIRQFELAAKYSDAVLIINKELEKSEKLFLFSYTKELLSKLISYPLKQSALTKANLKLADTYISSGDFIKGLDRLEEAKIKFLNPEQQTLRTKLLGIALIGTGKHKKGIEELRKIVNEVNGQQNSLFIEIASAEIELNNYEIVKEISKQVLKSKTKKSENIGRVYNLLGLVELYTGSKLKKVLQQFEKALNVYEDDNLIMRVASVEVNIGNIYNMMSDYEEAEKHWSRSLQINKLIGNIDQEAKILLNYGIYFYDHLQFENAIENYSRAQKIFRGLGNNYGEGLVLTNLGESQLAICEYQHSIESLNNAVEIFSKLSNNDELRESLFLLGKLYSLIGNNDELDLVITEYIKSYGDDTEQTHGKTHLKYLQILHSLRRKYKKDKCKKLLDVGIEYDKMNEKHYSTEIKLLVAECHFIAGDIEQAFNVVTEDGLIKTCSSNAIFEATRLFILSNISAASEDFNLKPNLIYLQKAIDIIENESISEITWKVLSQFAKELNERGNTKKSEEYANYAKSLLQLNNNNLRDEKLKNFYLNEPIRSITLKELDKIL